MSDVEGLVVRSTLLAYQSRTHVPSKKWFLVQWKIITCHIEYTKYGRKTFAIDVFEPGSKTIHTEKKEEKFTSICVDAHWLGSERYHYHASWHAVIFISSHRY